MRIALATVGTTGDVLPFATLARALVQRGHQVTAVTWPVHAAALDLPGVRVEAAGPHADPARIDEVAARAAGRGPMEQVGILRDFHLEDGAAHLRRLGELLPGHDIVLLHGIHALAHAAVLDTGLRWASAVFDPILLPTSSAPPAGMPNLGPANRLAWWMLGRALTRTGGRSTICSFAAVVPNATCRCSERDRRSCTWLAVRRRSSGSHPTSRSERRLRVGGWIDRRRPRYPTWSRTSWPMDRPRW